MFLTFWGLQAFVKDTKRAEQWARTALAIAPDDYLTLYNIACYYSVGGKQYVAVLVGSKQPISVLPNAPELKNTSTASMLYVFGL